MGRAWDMFLKWYKLPAIKGENSKDLTAGVVTIIHGTVLPTWKLLRWETLNVLTPYTQKCNFVKY